MARRAEQTIFEDLNLLLFTAWEHGARHAALQPEGEGAEIRFLGPDGSEHAERLSLPYKNLVRRLRQLIARMGRVQLNMGGHQWHLDADIPGSRRPDRIFLHMRAKED
jgi:hypothetical protein